MPIDFPNPTTNPTFVFGTRRWRWSGEQWVCENVTKNIGSVNGVLSADGVENFYSTPRFVDQVTNSLSATKIGEVTVGPGSAYSSFGIQPVGTYEIRYVSGYVPSSYYSNVSVILRMYPISDPMTKLSHGYNLTFYHGDATKPIELAFYDNNYSGNTGSVTYALHKINFQ